MKLPNHLPQTPYLFTNSAITNLLLSGYKFSNLNNSFNCNSKNKKNKSHSTVKCLEFR